jgi:hypothetical protein
VKSIRNPSHTLPMVASDSSRIACIEMQYECDVTAPKTRYLKRRYMRISAQYPVGHVEIGDGL